MAYRYGSYRTTEGLVDLVYDGYTNEGRVISLAAHLARRGHVPIETHWNADIYRVRVPLAAGIAAPVVHRLPEFRAPVRPSRCSTCSSTCVLEAPTDIATLPWQPTRGETSSIMKKA